MRILFELDYKNYKENGTIGKRPSSRGLILKDGKIAMVYSKKYNYYKFPGGGIEKEESNIDALVREVKEEVGLDIIIESIKEYGLVIRKDIGSEKDILLQENYYYICNVKDDITNQSLDEYETEEGFCLKFVSKDTIIKTNLSENHNNTSLNNMHIIERDTKVIKLLIQEDII